MFQVRDNDKPADCKHHTVSVVWNKSTYLTFAGALAYARDWLGGAYNVLLEGAGEEIVGKKIYYGGAGDYVSIVEVDTREEVWAGGK